MNYFFVSQRNQAVENGMKKLTAPDDKSHSYIKEYIRQNDLIVQYNSETFCITGVAKAIKDPYVSNDRIYVDIEIYNFVKPLKKDVWVKTMRIKQDGLKTPVNENYGINSRYLQRMNLPSFNYVLDEAEKSDADKNIVNIIRKMIPEGNIPDIFPEPIFDKSEIIQKILFGAPGTGKSFEIDDPEKGYGLKDVDESRKFRTTFHPDYDYAQFVGAYKPKKDGNAITYSFVPQVFAKAYAAAWKQYFAAGNTSTADNQVYLVIEEINRGNCAQIFGDIFQLLDRDGEGFSQYSIDADCDFAEWLKEDSILKTVWSDYETKVGEGKLKLPPNLNILATMNTSDQSLFPMDSAFKRRFDWEYVPISFTDEEGNEKEAAKYEIDIPDANGKNYLWKNFVETVNAKILDLTESEDKQLGEFFIKPDSGNVISKERFLGKVMFYLWNEVCKDEHKNGSFFRAKINDKEDFFTFQDLYKKKDLLKLFMDGLLAPKN
jgi:hypothetical protein